MRVVCYHACAAPLLEDYLPRPASVLRLPLVYLVYPRTLLDRVGREVITSAQWPRSRRTTERDGAVRLQGGAEPRLVDRR